MRPPGHSEVNGSIDRSTTSAERLSAEHHFAVIASRATNRCGTPMTNRCATFVIVSPTDHWSASTSVPAPVATPSCWSSSSQIERRSSRSIAASPCSSSAARGRPGNAPPRAVKPSGSPSGPARSTSSRRSTRCTTSISTGSSKKSHECWLRAAICSSTPAHRSRTPGRSGVERSPDSRPASTACTTRRPCVAHCGRWARWTRDRSASPAGRHRARLAERVRGRAYSTFALYEPDELERALDRFLQRPGRTRGGLLARSQPARPRATALTDSPLIAYQRVIEGHDPRSPRLSRPASGAWGAPA